MNNKIYIFLIFISMLIMSCSTLNNNSGEVISPLYDDEGYTEKIYYRIVNKGLFTNRKDVYPLNSKEIVVQGRFKRSLFSGYFLLGKQYEHFNWNGIIRHNDEAIDMKYKFKISFFDYYELLDLTWSLNSINKNEVIDIVEQVQKFPYQILDNWNIVVKVTDHPKSILKSKHALWHSVDLLTYPEQEFRFYNKSGNELAILNNKVLYLKSNLSDYEKSLVIQYGALCVSLQQNVNSAIRIFNAGFESDDE